MPFSTPTLRKLIQDGEADIAIELDIQKLPPVGVEKAINISVSSQLRDLYDHQSWIADQIIPTTKSDDQTIIDTAVTEGVIRKQATFATGVVTFTGTATLPADTEMQSADNIVFRVTVDALPVGGQITANVQADEAGVDSNLAADETLTLLSPVAGVGSTGAVASGGITGGSDIEPISELLDRLLFRKRNPPVGGALHDYVIWARELAGVSRAWAYDCWHGTGTVGLAWLYDDRDDIIPTDADKVTMENYLFRHADPATGNYVGKPGGIECWPVIISLHPVDMSIRLTPDTTATRAAVQASLLALQKQMSPGKTLQISALRTAIGSSSGVTDYTLSVNADITVPAAELVTIGVLTWLTT